MKRILSLTLAMSVLSLSANAATLSADPTPEAAAQAKQLRDEAHTWAWTGAALMAGGLVYEVLGQTSLATESTFCSSVFNLFSCQTYKDPNMGAVYGGAMMAVGGSIMLVVAGVKMQTAKKLAPDIRFDRHGIHATKTIAWR